MDYVVQTPSQLGKALLSRRKSIPLSQKEAAELVGLLPKTISNLENNPLTSSVESLLKLLSALNMKVVLSPREETDKQLLHVEW